MTRLRIGAGALAILVGSMLPLAPGEAHHSFAMFDQTQVLTVTGTVKEFQWVNPHVVLYVYGATTAEGAAEDWVVELTSPGNLTRTGWTRHSISVGDKIAVDISPLRDGTHGGAFRKAVLPESGKELSASFKDQEKPGLQ